MLKRTTFILLLITLLAVVNTVSAGTVFPNQAARSGVTKGVSYLNSVQNSDGGFPRSAKEKSSPSVTAWVIMALSAAGENVNGVNWTKGNNNPATYLRANADVSETIDIARIVLAMSAAGHQSVIGDNDLAAKLRSRQDGQGRFGTAEEKGMINTHIWAVLALKSVGDIPGRDRARSWLLSQQGADGGFGWATGIDSDPDDTAAAIQALRALGESRESSAMKRAIQYLALCQQHDGGFSWLGLAASNAATNGWVLQGMAAAGANPLDNAWTKEGKTAVDHLLSLQESSGKFLWQTGRESNPVQMTAFAILGLSGKTHPVSGPVKQATVPLQTNTAPPEINTGHTSGPDSVKTESSQPAENTRPKDDTTTSSTDEQKSTDDDLIITDEDNADFAQGEETADLPDDNESLKSSQTIPYMLIFLITASAIAAAWWHVIKKIKARIK